jgi:tRNA1(Val) A37 N6-methylase TrmN6
MSKSAFADDYLPFFDTKVSFNIRDYHGREWKKLPPEDQDRWVEEVFQYYRHTYGFPFHVMSPAKIRAHLGHLRNLNTDSLVRDDVIRWNATGLVLCSHFFPHVWKVPVRDINSPDKFRRTAWEAFHIDDALRDCIRLSFRMGNGDVMPNDLIDSFGCGCGKWWVGVPSRFKPSTAKFVWEKYASDGGIVYDYAAGWGGRLLGAASSKKDLTYVAVDPNQETWDCLQKLGECVVDNYAIPADRLRVEKVGSEDFCPDDLRGRVDVAFSSPPYFNLEAYSNEPTQSHVKFNEVNSWLDGYMRKTIENCFTLLKPGGHFAINIKDTQPYSFVDQILDAAKQIGFKPAATWQMEMKQRRGHGMPNDVHFNYEPIYVMQKP